ncbi:MAG: hypothetical protein M3441_20245 [Chloroflexota bacterium]|nr:hypothetical protein [Chloroflexota bacterium]
MRPQDHNRVLGLIHGLVGILILLGIIIAVALEARRRPSDAAQRLAWLLYVLPLPLLQLLTACGILARRRWGRILALALSALYVWVFPLGTLLAVYTYWFLLSGPARRLYAVNPPAELNGR